MDENSKQTLAEPLLENRVYTLKQLEPILNIGYRTLREYCKTGRLKGVKVGNVWRVTAESVKDLLERGTKGLAKDPIPQDDV